MKRREFLKASLVAPLVASCGGDHPTTPSPAPTPTPAPTPQPPPSGSLVFHLRGVPDQPFTGAANHHTGVDALLKLMGRSGLKFHCRPECDPGTRA